MASESRLAARSGGVPVRIRLTGTSSALPLQGPWDLCYRVYLIRDVARRAALADAAGDLAPQLVVELGAFAEDDEQRHPAVGAGAGDVDDERVEDVGRG